MKMASVGIWVSFPSQTLLKQSNECDRILKHVLIICDTLAGPSSGVGFSAKVLQEILDEDQTS